MFTKLGIFMITEIAQFVFLSANRFKHFLNEE